MPNLLSETTGPLSFFDKRLFVHGLIIRNFVLYFKVILAAKQCGIDFCRQHYLCLLMIEMLNELRK